MNNYYAVVAFVVFVFLSVTFMGIWVYKDAKSRNLKAGLWTLIAMSGNNCSGLFLYFLLGRKTTKDFVIKPFIPYAIGFGISFVGLLITFAFIGYSIITGTM